MEAGDGDELQIPGTQHTIIQLYFCSFLYLTLVRNSTITTDFNGGTSLSAFLALYCLASERTVAFVLAFHRF